MDTSADNVSAANAVFANFLAKHNTANNSNSQKVNGPEDDPDAIQTLSEPEQEVEAEASEEEQEEEDEAEPENDVDIEVERQIRRLLAEGKVASYEKAEL